MTPVAPTRQQERREASTRALLRAAGELIVEGGFGAVTFAAVGERAGLSRGMVTARFGNKAGLIEALLERIVGTWSERNILDDPPDRSGREALLALVDAIERQLERDAEGVRVLYALLFEAVGGEPLLHDRIVEFHREMRASMAAIVQKGQADGSIRPDLDPAAEAAFVVTTLRGVGYQWRLDDTTFDAAAALRHARDVLENHLRPETDR